MPLDGKTREAINAYHREYRRSRPEWQEYYKTYDRIRRETDPEYVERRRQLARKYNQNLPDATKQLIREKARVKAKAKYDNDEDYRILHIDACKKRYAMKQALSFLNKCFANLNQRLSRVVAGSATQPPNQLLRSERAQANQRLSRDYASLSKI